MYTIQHTHTYIHTHALLYIYIYIIYMHIYICTHVYGTTSLGLFSCLDLVRRQRSPKSPRERGWPGYGLGFQELPGFKGFRGLGFRGLRFRVLALGFRVKGFRV